MFGGQEMAFSAGPVPEPAFSEDETCMSDNTWLCLKGVNLV